jgi:DNA-binding response OmpR family regulator
MKTNSKTRILYVEDDQTLSFITKDNLERKGYEVICCEDGSSALQIIRQTKFHICILDIMLPKMDGFTLAENIRKTDKNIPIIFLTAKNMSADRIKGFTIGGDDYITKPFSIEELVMKIEVFLRRSIVSTNMNDTQIKFLFKNYELDFDSLQLTDKTDGTVKKLTLKEAELLKFFVMNQNKLLNRSDILNTVWGNDDYFMGRSLDVFITRLRRLFKHDTHVRIENLHGIGFKFIVK